MQDYCGVIVRAVQRLGKRIDGLLNTLALSCLSAVHRTFFLWLSDRTFVDKANGIRIGLPDSNWYFCKRKNQYRFSVFDRTISFEYFVGIVANDSEIQTSISDKLKLFKEKQYPKYNVNIMSTKNVQIGRNSALEIIYEIDRSQEIEEEYFPREKIRSMQFDKTDFLKEFGRKSLIALFIFSKQKLIYLGQEFNLIVPPGTISTDGARKYLYALVESMEVL